MNKIHNFRNDDGFDSKNESRTRHRLSHTHALIYVYLVSTSLLSSSTPYIEISQYNMCRNKANTQSNSLCVCEGAVNNVNNWYGIGRNRAIK